MTLNVYNERKISKIFNVVGMIRGELEPGIKINICIDQSSNIYLIKSI